MNSLYSSMVIGSIFPVLLEKACNLGDGVNLLMMHVKVVFGRGICI